MSKSYVFLSFYYLNFGKQPILFDFYLIKTFVGVVCGSKLGVE